MLLETCTDHLAFSLWMLILTNAVVKLLFRGASKNPMPFLLWSEFFLGILQVSYQIIFLNACQISESCNNFNLIKLVKIVCCVFNGTQCINQHNICINFVCWKKLWAILSIETAMSILFSLEKKGLKILFSAMKVGY